MMTAAVIKRMVANRKAGIVLTAGIIPISAIIAVLTCCSRTHQIKRIEVLSTGTVYPGERLSGSQDKRSDRGDSPCFGTGGVKPEQPAPYTRVFKVIISTCFQASLGIWNYSSPVL